MQTYVGERRGGGKAEGDLTQFCKHESKLVLSVLHVLCGLSRLQEVEDTCDKGGSYADVVLAGSQLANIITSKVVQHRLYQDLGRIL